MRIDKADVIEGMKKKHPNNPEYFLDMGKILEVINEHIAAVEEQRLNRKKVNGFSGLNNNEISAWATDKATDFDGPLDDDGLRDTLKYAYERGRSMADAVEGYIKPMITGEDWGNSAYGELPEMARTLLDGMIEEINWHEVAEHYSEDLNFICPICKREECDGKDDEDDCENKNDQGQALCPECLSPDCPNADGSADEECEIDEPCEHCMEKSCKSLRTNEPLDCPDYEEPDNVEPHMFVDAEGKEHIVFFESEADQISYHTDPDRFHTTPAVEDELNNRMQQIADGLTKAYWPNAEDKPDDGELPKE